MTTTRLAAALCAATLLACGARAADAPLTVPFDFSRSAIGLDLTVKGVPLYMILDTGVDPSAIDTRRADALGLPVERGAGGEATGEGDAATAQIFPATIDGIVLGGRAFPAVDAAAMDMSALSARYGRTLDGVLGYSFLHDKIVLIDYPHRTLGLLSGVAQAIPAIRGCARHFTIALRSFEGDEIPVIADFRFGDATAPISLDTGSNGGISLYTGALDLPGVRAGLAGTGEKESTGARGNTTVRTATLNMPVGFGPFKLPAGQAVTLANVAGSSDTRLANIGNKFFAALQLKMLLDYPGRRITFYGACRD